MKISKLHKFEHACITIRTMIKIRSATIVISAAILPATGQALLNPTKLPSCVTAHVKLPHHVLTWLLATCYL